MVKTNTTICDVEDNSLAQQAGIKAGDVLLSVNGHRVYDILEYKFLTAEYEVELSIQKPDGTLDNVILECDYEDLGIIFEDELLCEAQSCRNNCIFCFIDQLPKGMRDTVYFKDDDTRLSFLQGNYVTLTNLTDEDIDRLIELRVSPINISVHTTNPKLRADMLNNRFAGKLFNIMKKLADNGIYMNCQIVLCPGINDGDELTRSLDDMASLGQYVQSISVVPVGLTAYRQGLYPLKPFDRKGCISVIEQVESLQQKYLNTLGTRLVYLSDEFYVNAGKKTPKADTYEGFPQLENGVGLIASMEEEIDSAIKMIKDKPRHRHITIATGEISYSFIRESADKIQKAAKGVIVDVLPVKNNFFGGGVSVTGLVCGCDLIETLKSDCRTHEVMIASSMLRADEDVFLDDVTVEDVQNQAGVKLVPTDNDGFVFVEHILGEELEF